MAKKWLLAPTMIVVALTLSAARSGAEAPVSAQNGAQRSVGSVGLRGDTQTARIVGMTFTYKDKAPVDVEEVSGMTAAPGETKGVPLPRGKYSWPDDVHISYELDDVQRPARDVPNSDPPWNDPPWPIRSGHWYGLSPEEIMIVEEYIVYLPISSKDYQP